MINKILLLIVFVLVSNSLYSHDNHPKAPAKKMKYLSETDSLLHEGVRKVDEKKYFESLDFFDRAHALDTSRWEILYEKALAYYQMQKFDTVITMLEPLQYRSDLSDNFYRVLGSSYDIQKEYDKAKAVYDTALSRFPNSGKIYMEYGIHYLENKQYPDAVARWQKGLEVEPDYENNYYLLTKYLFHTGEYGWTIMFGEVFMNISTNTERLEDISMFIDNSITTAAFFPEDSTNTVIKFTKINILSKNLKQREDLPFELAYQIFMKEACENLLPKIQDSLTIDLIYQIRKKFIELWFKENFNIKYPNPLFDLHYKMLLSGHFDTYNYWLFNTPRKQDAQQWFAKNQQKLQKFGEWMVANGLKMSKANYFNQDRYIKKY